MECSVAPAPIAALLFRSSTESLLPSQCSHNPWRTRWFQRDGRSAVPTVVSEAKFVSAENISLYGLNVSTRPGPWGGRLSNQAMRGSRSRMPFCVALIANNR